MCQVSSSTHQVSNSTCQVALSPGPTQKIGKGAWSHLQTFLYVLSQHIMQQLRGPYVTCGSQLLFMMTL